MKKIEKRTFNAVIKIEERDNQPPKIVGHAAVFNSLSEDLGGFREQIAPGAFAHAIETDDVRALWNHNPDYVLGRNKAGTLILVEDERGLAIEIEPPDTQYARDLMVSMKRGDVSQMSFSFRVAPNGQKVERSEDGMQLRTLTKVKLYDVSPVTYPAYTETDVALRSMQEWQEENKPIAPDFSIKKRLLQLMEVE